MLADKDELIDIIRGSKELLSYQKKEVIGCGKASMMYTKLIGDWISVEDNLPPRTGEYLCTIEWYGTVSEKILKQRGIQCELKVKIVGYHDSYQTFQQCDGFCNFKVIAWMELPSSYKKGVV